MGKKKDPAKIRGTPDLKILFADQSGEIVYGAHQLAYITHFIVVPANGFDQLLVAHGHHFGLRGIKERAEMTSHHIGTYDFIFGISEAFITCSFHRRIDFFNRYFFI